MGECPTCCPNYYYSNYTSFFVSNGSDTINPLINNNAEIEAYTTVGYNISSTLLSSPMSASGNTFPNGTVWINSNVYQYFLGYCVGGNVGPNDTVTNNITNQLAAQPYPGGQQMQFETENGPSYSFQGVNFLIYWVDLTSTSVTCLSPSGPSLTCSADTSNSGSPAGVMSEYYPNSTVVFTSGSSTAQCKLPGTSSNNSCNVTFDPTGTMVTATYMGDASHSKSSASVTIQPATTTSTSMTTTSESSSSISSSDATSSTSSLTSSSTSSLTSSSTSSQTSSNSSIFSSSSDPLSNSSVSSTNSTSISSTSNSTIPQAPPANFLSSFDKISFTWIAIGAIVIAAAVLATTFVLSRRESREWIV
jgi:hypothetical protein